MLRRRSLLASAGGRIAIAGLTADAVRTAARAATPRDLIVMAKQIDDIISFDPAESYEFSNNEVDGNIYRRLVAPDHADTTKVIGDAAESWTVSADGRIFTFVLRPDAVFPSGRAATAEDAAFSLRRVVKLNKTPGFILTQFGFTRENVDTLIKAIDGRTLHFELPAAQSTSFVLFCLSANVGSIVEKVTVLANEANGDLGNAWLKTHSAGAGGYQLTSYAASDHVTIDVNPHSGISTSSRRVVIRHVADPSAQLLMLQKGGADIVRNLTPDQLKTIRDNPEFHVTSSPQSSQIYIALNQNVLELAKPQVRQALKWAIDYDAIATNITPNSYVVSQSFLPAGLPGALTDKPFHRDVAKARALLAEAGLADGFSVSMDCPSVQPYADIAQAIQADLAAIGVKVNLVVGDTKQVITKTRARQHQLALLYWGTDYFDPNSNARICSSPHSAGALRGNPSPHRPT